MISFDKAAEWQSLFGGEDRKSGRKWLSLQKSPEILHQSSLSVKSWNQSNMMYAFLLSFLGLWGVRRVKPLSGSWSQRASGANMESFWGNLRRSMDETSGGFCSPELLSLETHF